MGDHDRIRDTYDTVAASYAREISGELAHKPLDRGLLDALAALVDGTLADVGCGPGHVTAYLAARGAQVLGVDLSPAMVAIARERHPGLQFEEGSMTALTTPSGAWGGAAALYSVIHLSPADRDRAYRELARVVRAEGWLLVAFHTEAAGLPPGSVHHLAEWWGHEVDLDAFFLEPEREIRALELAGWAQYARLDRDPGPSEYPSRRTYLLLQRRRAQGET